MSYDKEEFKKLVEEGKVSKCGRYLKLPAPGTDMSYLNTDLNKEVLFAGYSNESDEECRFENLMLESGMLFYSIDHSTLARDTMEAEQICRHCSDGDVRDYMYHLKPAILYNLSEEKQSGYLDSNGSKKLRENLIKRFGEKRLKEILNQELEN